MYKDRLAIRRQNTFIAVEATSLKGKFLASLEPKFCHFHCKPYKNIQNRTSALG